ncbi:MAG: aminoacetone oxidase family FAD-binding enzyme [Clostridia bacterium]|nr:aminoacetone oxidase family FAD-binding enzyme [Clostridia bacterium]
MKNNTKNFDIAIVGGGASGLFCAVMVKSRAPQLKVAILERQDRVGRKLLVTGNGRCNLTNLHLTSDNYHGSFDGIDSLLEMCPPSLIVSLFEDLGLLTYAESDGRVYPLSKQANSVLDILRLNCESFGVRTLCDYDVSDIKANTNGFSIINSKGEKISSERVVIATGNNASPTTGADNSIFSVLQKLGHTVTPLYPALCPVAVKSPHLKSLKGVRASGLASIIKNGIVVKKEYGEIQFTEKALSGICLFNLSRVANTEKDTQISLSLLPDYNFSQIFELLKQKKTKLNKSATAQDLFVGVFNRMIGNAILKESGISPGTITTDISDQELKKISSLINDWRFDVVPSTDFSKAQVTAGGILGDEITPETMMSRKVNNLYILGEAIDCDGDCGGMNLQFAFASAYCAACDLTK